MPKFVKKPVEIEAVRFVRLLDAGGDVPCLAVEGELPEWLRDAMRKPQDAAGAVFTSDSPGGKVLLIETLEGLHRAEPGDWIIRGVKGELYPCKPDIFEMTYSRIVEGEELSQRLAEPQTFDDDLAATIARWWVCGGYPPETLARYLAGCLRVFGEAVKEREASEFDEHMAEAAGSADPLGELSIAAYSSEGEG